MAALLVLAACRQEAPPPAETPAPGSWRIFEGSWSASGDRRTIEAGPDRLAGVIDVTGTVLLRGQSGLGVGFQARAVVLSDGAGGGLGRAVWTDERGDRIFSELRGQAGAAGRHVTGSFTGGTGRWAGITGEYDFEWSYLVEDEGRIQGRSTGLRGRARLEPARGAP